MAKPFKGTIALDIRDSVPDWDPYAEPKAQDIFGKKPPNILYLVIDDTGFGAWNMFGGLIQMPNLTRIADQGLIYTNFHTTALCSPTRSSLLNGRNATSNGMSCIEEMTTGFPGSNGRVPFENAMIPAVLKEIGYCTFCVGKWHLAPEEEANMASSKRHWPIGHGFERYYGFLGGESDQWYPELFYDNHLTEAPYGPNMTVLEEPDGGEGTKYTPQGYHLSKDLVDKAILFIQDSIAIAPDKPWMMYFSPGANHAPHQIWPEMILEYGYNDRLTYIESAGDGDPGQLSFEHHSVFKDGYEAYRTTVLNNMKTLGIFDDLTLIPSEINPHGEGALEDNPDAVIPGVPDGKQWPASDYVRPWDGLNQQEKALFVRMAEIYAAFSTYTDEQIGRILDFLEKTGQMENTIIIAVADNGASAEGGPNGSVNENLFFNDVPDHFANNFAKLDELGTDTTYNHYPTGWAWGFDTPFKYWKRWSGYEGGAATPFMISGPGIEVDPADSGLRKQYIHAVDLVPTLYETLGVEPPEVVGGYTQNPIEGTSFAYTFDLDYDDPSKQFPYALADTEKPQVDGKPIQVKESQFYSMLGTRGMWYKGWHACTVHAPTPSDWGNFELDTWELYCMDGDPATLVDLIATLDADPTQSTNLVDPTVLSSFDPADQDALKQQLERMKSMWYTNAGIYKGLPLDDRSTSVLFGEERPQLRPPPFPDGSLPTDTFSYTYYPGGSPIPEAVAPNVRTRSFSIAAHVDFTGADLTDGTTAPEGVLFAMGGRFGGHALYLYEGKLCYVYNWIGEHVQKISYDLIQHATALLQETDPVELKVRFHKSATQNTSDPFTDVYGYSILGTVQLMIGGQHAPNETREILDSNGDWEDWSTAHHAWTAHDQFITQPGKFGIGEGLCIGFDSAQPVSPDYVIPGEFEGNGALLDHVVVTIQNNAEPVNTAREYAAMLWRD